MTLNASEAMAEQDDISIVTVDNAAVFATDLFRQTFKESPPRDPIHYVAFCKIGPAQFEVAGYYHLTDCGTYGLGGGLCVDPRYRNRGLGEALAGIVFVNPGKKKAIFGYTGDPTTIRIINRMGYVHTQHQYLVVRWLVSLSEYEQQALIDEVAARGPF